MDHKSASGTLIPGGKCFDSRTFILTSCALSIFMDLIISNHSPPPYSSHTY
jgi:hypothetical protein